jgi:hypothetical protein
MGGEPGDAECEALVAATANCFKTVMREFTDRVLTLKERNKETTTDQAALQEGLSQWQAEHKKLLGAAFSDMNRQRFRLEFEVPGGHVKQVLNRATPIIMKLKTTVERQMQVVVDHQKDYLGGHWDQPKKSYEVVDDEVQGVVVNLWRTLYTDPEPGRKSVNS